MFGKMRVGILGAGKIAAVMADTLVKMGKAEAYAVASRSREKAYAFAKEHGVKVSYGSYQDMLKDKKVDLVYVATPHTFHYEHARMCIDYGKPVLVEKPFCVNAKEAEKLLDYAKERNTFITEAIWTRYQPMRQTINEVIVSGAIGEPKFLTANLGFNILDKDRVIKPELAGGALLDVGVYPLHFAAMVFGHDIAQMHASATFTETKVDANDSITILYKDGRMAVLNSSMQAFSDRKAVIQGTKGFMIIENTNNPESYVVYGGDNQKVKAGKRPRQITGYEYEVEACRKAIAAKKIYCEEMPHEEILRMMRQLDQIRNLCNIHYDFED